MGKEPFHRPGHSYRYQPADRFVHMLPQPEPVSTPRFPLYKLPPEHAFVLVEKDMRYIPMCTVDECLKSSILIGDEQLKGKILVASGLHFETAEARLIEHLARHNIALPAGIDFTPFGTILEQPPVKEFPFKDRKKSSVTYY